MLKLLIVIIFTNVTLLLHHCTVGNIVTELQEELSQLSNRNGYLIRRSKRLVSILNERRLERFLETVYEPQANEMAYRQTLAEWNHLVDISDKEKENILVNETLASAQFDNFYWETYFSKMKPEHFRDESLQRQISKLSGVGRSIMNEEDMANLTKIVNNMTSIYSTAKICPYEKQCCNLAKEGLQLEPDLERIMATSTNYEKLKYTWISWRDATGAKMKQQYKDYVRLSNIEARANGFCNKGVMWQSEFEMKSIYGFINSMWDKIEPLYNELHKYVYMKLKKRYPQISKNNDNLIPAHLLGNMWAQSWLSLSNFVRPFPNAIKIDVTSALLKHNYTVLKMFQVADEFYKSLGLMNANMSYGPTAMIVKPKEREVLCHASAWDFSTKKDFRIKMCTDITFEDFITIHHELGHIQYFMQYSHLPRVFRSGANPGFHEAIGDTIALSVTTPTHLHRIGLLKNYTDNEQTAINDLMDMALDRLAFLPYSIIVDLWRWDVFRGKVDKIGWNAHWWQYRRVYQKIKPPLEKSDDDFDPGSKFHVAADTPYISYFFAHILEFQLHRSLCQTAGRYELNKLHKCDIYQSKQAGDKLRSGLALGSSEHWTWVLQKMTGQKKLSATPLIEYFNPLYTWLVKENSKYP